jgi:hypothetical protein
MSLLKFLLFIALLFQTFAFSKERSSSYPYLSGDSWRLFCDWQVGKKQEFDPSKVRLGDTIFVEYDSLERFAKRYLPKIQHRFVLITPNCERGGDSPMPGRFAFLLENDKIAAWFVQNLDGSSSAKLVPIPIGLANNYWEHGDTALLDHAIPIALTKESRERDIFIYVNFSTHTNPREREGCFKHFANMTKTHIAKAKPFGAYLDDLARTVFVVSPPGNGLDCHRTWEALLMGCYPVVKSSTLNSLYEGLPVVIVKEWSDATEKFLEKKRREFDAKIYSRDKLYAAYWFYKVRKIQDKLKEQQV